MSIEEDNKAIIRRFYDVYNTGREDILNEIIASDYLDYGAGEPTKGLEAAQGNVRALSSGFDQMHFAIDALIAEGDAVAARWAGSMRHSGTFFGNAPTGRHVSFAGMSMYRLRAGKIVETRVVQDVAGLLQQIGLQSNAS